MSDLHKRHCTPCPGDEVPFARDRAEQLLPQLSGWQLDASGCSLERSFDFHSFHQAMAFANAVAWIAHQEDHHPELQISYRRCSVRYTTHAINGLSINDFICASKIDALQH